MSNETTTQNSSLFNVWRDFAFPVTFFDLPVTVLACALIYLFHWTMPNFIFNAVMATIFILLHRFGYTPITIWWKARTLLGGKTCGVFPRIKNQVLTYK